MIQISEDRFKKMLNHLYEIAEDAANEYKKDKSNEFISGVNEGTYEMISALKNELEIAGIDLKKTALDVNIEKELC